MNKKVVQMRQEERKGKIVILCNHVSPYDPDVRTNCDRPIGHLGFHRCGFARWGRRDSDDPVFQSLVDYNLIKDNDVD